MAEYSFNLVFAELRIGDAELPNHKFKVCLILVFCRRKFKKE